MRVRFVAPSIVPAVLVGLVAGAGPARADDGDGGGGDAPMAAPERQDHKGQFGLGLSLVTGYRFIKTWDNSRYCGERAAESNGSGNSSYCVGHVPVSLDVSLSYGFTRGVEVLLDLRFGLERDFGSSPTADGPRLRAYAPGVKFWLSHGAVNYFSTAQLAIDTTGYTDGGGGDLGADVRLRNANGLQVDFHDSYGVYAYFGEELAFRRWLEGGLELGAGIQGRYP
ncbi:MAG TPA: hypothetical protein VHE35_02930 [Kofleriaceae bacterium]|nr:hypothetical protein [Kofleriaceae bacterium]